jgi:TolB-like protein
MKKKLTSIVCLLITLSAYAQSNRTVQLDAALMVAADRIDARIAPGSKIALINFNSSSDRFSSYVLDELSALLVESGNLTVIDRAEIDLIRGELDFQYSGEVDDNSMQEVGRLLGAQFIVSGALTAIGDTYRMVIRVLNVQTAAIEVQYRANIANDRMVKALLEGNRERTVGDKIGTGALNILFGLGSYLDGDIWGGITITAGYAVAAVLIIVEVTALDWDSPAVNIPGTIGLGIAGLSFIYGFVRPFIYNLSPRLAGIMDNTQFRIVQAPPNHDGINPLAFQMSYSIKF